MSFRVSWKDLIVGRKLGEGGFGVVHEAKLRGDDVAVKVGSRDRGGASASQGSLVCPDGGKETSSDEESSSFEREMRLLASLHHRHIVQFYAGGLLPGIPKVSRCRNAVFHHSGGITAS
jgi:serine/threonine protein kinase